MVWTKPDKVGFDLSGAVNAFLLVYAALFPIVNPVGTAPIFLRLTRVLSSSERSSSAAAVARNSFLLLLGSLLIGSHVLVFFGITLPIVRIAGGLVVAAFGWRLLHAGEEPDDKKNTAAEAGESVDSFYPLTMPLTVGPGSISVAVALGSQRPAPGTDISDFAFVAGGAIAGLAAIAVTIYVCYRFAGNLMAVLGERGSNVLMRLSAFILFCIGIQIVWNGYSALVHSAS
ncbi:MAG: NAAT family transporter [Rhizobiales bacterium]|nr:NAAT family transporter [Hyphomicrobiales bacterium]